MAFLRPMTHQALTDDKYDINSRDIHIKEKDRYSVAKRMFEEDEEILFFIIGTILMKNLAAVIPILLKNFFHNKESLNQFWHSL